MNLHRRSVVVIAGLAVCVPQAARAENVFSTCQAQAVARDGWKAVCADGWVLSLADGRDDVPVEELLGVLEKGLGDATKGQVVRAAGQLELPGKGWKVTSLQVKDPKEAGPGFALVAAGKLREGTRVVSCTGLSQKQEACKGAIRAVASAAWRSGPPAELPRDQSAPTFAGRPYQVPKGCEVVKQQGATAIGCQGDPVLIWLDQAPDAFATVESVMIGQILQGGMKEAAAVPCSIQGVSTKCRTFMPKVATDARSAYMARTTVRSQPVMVVCLAGSSTRPLPAACASVLTLARPKP
jgi:hypothetical protein